MLRRRVMMETKIEDNSLTFTALEDGTFTLTIPASVGTSSLTSVAYSLNNGATWVTTDNTASAVTITTPTVKAGRTVKWKGIGTAYSTGTSTSSYSRFSSTGSFSVSGNIMSLLFGGNYKEATEISNSYAFASLFYASNKITDASNLLLPATTLASYCYYYMFYGCTSLKTAPELPATTLAIYCYNRMFRGCTNLTTAPEILPATTLADYCYYQMLRDCTSLTTAPELPAATLVSNCYYQMFYGCTNLNSVTCLATSISPSNSRSNWLYNVSSSGTFKKAATMSSWSTGTNGIPNGWTVEDV